MPQNGWVETPDREDRSAETPSVLEIHVGDSMGTDGDGVLTTLIERHSRLSATLSSTLTERAASDEGSRSALDAWASALGVGSGAADSVEENVPTDSVEETSERVAEQVVARLLVDRLHSGVASASKSRPTSDERSESFALGRSISKAVDDGGNRVLEHDEIDDQIPLDAIVDELRRFADETDRSTIDPDVLGRFYERVLPEERRAAQGEFYTPKEICDLLTRLTIRAADDTVLDPACGAGSFLVSAYERKQALAAESDTESGTDASVEQVTGVDVNRYPTRLSALALAGRASVDPAAVDVRVSDFFEVAPTEGFDAVVANPPYVRGRSLDLDYKDAIREHLSAVDAEWLTRKMDLYGYFLTHATEFLRAGGRLGFVVSDRWLDTQYGTDLQRFVLDNFRIETVLRFRQQAFDDALVGSTALVLEAESDAAARQENTATFLDVRGPHSIDEIVALLDCNTATDRMEVTDEYRRVGIEQRRLRPLSKWNALFSAPPIYFDLRSARTVALGDRADLRTGLESGANDFFYRKWEDITALGLREHFTPLLRASGQIDRIRFDDGDAPEWGVFDVSDLTATALSADEQIGDQKSESDSQRVKDWLAEHGHDGVLDYVEWGETEGYHTTSRRCEQRDVWFAIGEIERSRPPLAIPLFAWRSHRAVWNVAEGVTDRQFHGVDPHDDVEAAVLCGILNSRLTWLAREIEGRHAGGQGMARLQLVKYETAGLPIPDPKVLSADERDRIVAALDDLLDRETTLAAEGVTDPATRLERTEAERDALDRAVLSTLGLADRLDELKNAVQRLVERRRERAGGRSTIQI